MTIYENCNIIVSVFHILTAGEHAERAFNLGLAAILGEGIYNFGELVSIIKQGCNSQGKTSDDFFSR